jgi:streptogramin lyase
LRRSVGLGAISILCALTFAGCGGKTVIGSGPLPTPSPVPPNVSFEYKVPTASAAPAAIVTGRDGFLYFTETAASQIGQLTTGGSFKEDKTKTAAAAPTGILVSTGDGNIWFTERAIHSIATITAFSTSTMTEYSVPWAGAAPQFLANGPAQNTMYFTDPGANAIGEITTTGTVTGPFAIPTGSANPQGIVQGPDLNIWFCENGAAKIGHLNATTNTVDHEYALAAGANPYDIIIGPDGALWFTENSAAPKLGRLTTTGVLNEYPLAGAKNATGMALDIFGNIDVVDAGNNAVGQFNVNSLTYNEFPIKTASSNPTWITLGPDGKMYFTETAANQIGQFSYF